MIHTRNGPTVRRRLARLDWIDGLWILGRVAIVGFLVYAVLVNYEVV